MKFGPRSTTLACNETVGQIPRHGHYRGGEGGRSRILLLIHAPLVQSSRIIDTSSGRSILVAAFASQWPP